MTDTVHLSRNQVPATLRGAYAGQFFQMTVTETVTIPADAGLWDGGSRSKFHAVRTVDGVVVQFPGQKAAPWDTARTDRKVTLVPGIAVIEHVIFCGKDLGLRISVHPADAAPLLPKPAELTAHERVVLEATRGLKSSYGGRDRYELAQGNVRYATPAVRDAFPTRAEWDATKASLIARKLLNKAGAITVDGRNAIPRGY